MQPSAFALPVKSGLLGPVSRAVSSPWLWLVAVLCLGAILRCLHLTDPFQLDEFGPLYAIAERQNTPPGFTSSVSDPLVPVSSWEEVRRRSVLPYGVVNPFPLYHGLLYLLIQLMPIADWSLRLPSVVAGLGCVAGLFLLCRRPLGTDVALAAAALAAVDPMQVLVSVLARPYALGNLACVFSFLALERLLHATNERQRALAALAYGLAVGFMAYMSVLYLLVGAAHVALVGYAALRRLPAFARSLCWWLLGGGLAGLLLLPQWPYLAAIREFSNANQDYLYLALLGTAPFGIVVLHNSSFLLCLVALSLSALVLRLEWLLARASTKIRAQREGPAASSSAGTEVVWLGRFWFFLPQLAAVALMYAAHQAVFLSRYLGSTTLGGAVILANAARHQGSRAAFIGLTGVMLALMLWWADKPASKGFNVVTWAEANSVVQQLDALQQKGLWRQGDVLLYRPAFLEGDFLPNQLPARTRQAVEGIIASPLTTLYAMKAPVPFVTLSLSHRRGKIWTQYVGHIYEPISLYNQNLAEELRTYRRFWVSSYDWERPTFLACFLPWLADALGWDLLIPRNRPGVARYIEAPAGSREDEFLPGLSEQRVSDFGHLVLVRRYRPRGVFSLGMLLAAPMPNGHVTMPVWLIAQERTIPAGHRLILPVSGE